MSLNILELYGSYRSDRKGIRLAHFVADGFCARGGTFELVDAKSIELSIIDRMYKEHAPAGPDMVGESREDTVVGERATILNRDC